MTDPWARPSDDGATAHPRSGEPIEIELDGPDAVSSGRSDGNDGDADDADPNWRAVAGLASVAGVVLGVIAAGVIFWSDDDGTDDPPSTTIAADELATDITTPPTLPPVETRPPTTIDNPAPTASETRPITVPTYPPPSGAVAPWPEVPIEFDSLDESMVAEIVTDSSRRLGPSAGRMLWDAVNERFELQPDITASSARTIYDTATETIYESTGSLGSSGRATWTSTPASQYFGPDVSAIDNFREILLGPVRADNVDQAITVETDELVRNVRMTPTRRTTYRMPESALGLWGSEVGGVSNVDVYADEAGRVARMQTLSDLAGVRSALVYSPTRADISIELPDSDDLVDAVSGDEPDLLPALDTAESLRPRYEKFGPVPAASTGQFSIAAALDNLFGDPPAAASVDVLWSENATRITAQRDDVNDRRLMTLTNDSSPVINVQIDDADSASTLLTDDIDGRWTRLTSTGQGGRRLPVDERLISGMLSRSAIEEARVVWPYGFVSLPDGTDALEVHLQLEPGALLLPSLLPMELDPGRPVDVYLYVGAGVVHEIQVLSNQRPRLIIQRFDLRARPEITLPDPSRIVDG